MVEQVQVIRVAWCSLMDLPQAQDWPLQFEWIRVDALALSAKGFDILVLDIKSFHNLEQVKYLYSTIGLPTVILVDTIEQESAVLDWLQPGDETCHRQAVERQIGLRLQRSFWHSQHKYSLHLDKLTGVANFQKFKDYAIALLTSKEDEDSVCLIYIDIDRFKFIRKMGLKPPPSRGTSH
ncbi:MULTISPECIES: GGDEF domain-containing protein [Calothrix]|uniref:GGDEF domain-containing protein n=2 Tax=Calothrix TaxID=1186 RepID=A0ABR8AAH2_9CYAN|nr:MULTISPECIES: GGDEF domain-containing protein [Calothrix]MBD2196936.1 GGDEF domain-containing protein [Calothrix parietina FACHB-288]MBD2225394.1 GGDEF domain-containing protein [Calothrix anomala FACHB-343]